MKIKANQATPVYTIRDLCEGETFYFSDEADNPNNLIILCDDNSYVYLASGCRYELNDEELDKPIVPANNTYIGFEK